MSWLSLRLRGDPTGCSPLLLGTLLSAWASQQLCASSVCTVVASKLFIFSSSSGMAAQDWGGVITYDVPSGVYDDFLEHFLVLSCARRLYMRCNGAAPPRHIGMMSRNDLVGWAASFLQNPERQMFLDYADQLAAVFSGRRHPILPPPIWLDSPVHSPAEALARDLLEAGTCPLWSAACQVA